MSENSTPSPPTLVLVCPPPAATGRQRHLMARWNEAGCSSRFFAHEVGWLANLAVGEGDDGAGDCRSWCIVSSSSAVVVTRRCYYRPSDTSSQIRMHMRSSLLLVVAVATISLSSIAFARAWSLGFVNCSTTGIPRLSPTCCFLVGPQPKHHHR